MDPQSEGMKSRTISLVEAYVERDADGVEERSAAILRDGGVDAAISDLKVFAAFLARRVQETGLAWRPSDSREAVSRTVADMLPPEIELAVVSAWEAHALGEEEAAEQFTLGDPQIRLHMLAAFCAAIGQAVYEPAELISTLRLAAGL